MCFFSSSTMDNPVLRLSLRSTDCATFFKRARGTTSFVRLFSSITPNGLLYSLYRFPAFPQGPEFIEGQPYLTESFLYAMIITAHKEEKNANISCPHQTSVAAGAQIPRAGLRRDCQRNGTPRPRHPPVSVSADGCEGLGCLSARGGYLCPWTEWPARADAGHRRGLRGRDRGSAPCPDHNACRPRFLGTSGIRSRPPQPTSLTRDDTWESVLPETLIWPQDRRVESIVRSTPRRLFHFLKDVRH